MLNVIDHINEGESAHSDDLYSQVVKEAGSIGVPDIYTGDELKFNSDKINLMFAANVFSAKNGLDCLSEEELAAIHKSFHETETGSKEQRVARLWINSLGIPGA